LTKRRKRLDQIAQDNGWTHRVKNKSRDPYVKLRTRNDVTPPPKGSGAVYVDMDQKFRWLPDEDVVELK